jgi:ribosomal protein S18 acetylase RimI-like enzyme
MHTITIRPMTGDDVQHCAAMMVATPLWQRYGVTEESASSRLSAGLRDGAIMLVAVGQNNDETLGFVWLVLRGAFDHSGYIPLLAVKPGQRGAGIGQQLLAAAEERTRPSADDIFLTCSDFNVDAQRFYERHGYVKVGALADYILPDVAELIYRKRL